MKNIICVITLGITILCCAFGVITSSTSNTPAEYRGCTTDWDCEHFGVLTDE